MSLPGQLKLSDTWYTLCYANPTVVSIFDATILAFSGLGIANPVTTSDSEYRASTAINSQFTELILDQVQSTEQLDRKGMKDKVRVIKQVKEVQLKTKYL